MTDWTYCPDCKGLKSVNLGPAVLCSCNRVERSEAPPPSNPLPYTKEELDALAAEVHGPSATRVSAVYHPGNTVRIDITEFDRLLATARRVADLEAGIWERDKERLDLAVRLMDALEDSGRLDWLVANGVGVTGGFPSLSKAHLQRGDECRREIDSARTTRSGQRPNDSEKASER